MNKKLTSLLLSALTLGALIAHAQTAATPAATPEAAPAPAAAPAAPSSSLTLTPAFVSQYMFRGARLSGPSFEPTIEFDSGNFGIGVWANFPLKDKVVGQSDPEIDPYGFYTIEVAKDVTVVPGFTLYTYVNADKNNGFYKMTFEPNIALNYSVAGWKFTPKLYYDVVLKGPTYEFTAAYTVPLKDENTELDFTFTGGTFKWTDAFENSNPKAKNWGNYYLLGVSMPFQINDKSKFILGWAYTRGSDNFVKIGTDHKQPNSAALGRGVATISYAITF